MGLVDKNKDKVTPVDLSRNTVTSLTAEEYVFLFDVIRDCTFKGQDLEKLYKITLKLQKQYFDLKNS